MKTLDKLYRQILLNHQDSQFWNHALDRGMNKKRGCRFERAWAETPGCGDQLGMEIMVWRGRVVEFSIGGDGCALMRASAVILTDICWQKTIKQAEQITQKYLKLLRTGQGDPKILGDLMAFDGLHQSPARVECALLAPKLLSKLLLEYNKTYGK